MCWSSQSCKSPSEESSVLSTCMADLCMLESQCEQLTHAFQNSQTGLPKSVDCIRVDGPNDEGPSHEEVQYWWTERHILKQKVATIVTTRSIGCSYLNRVELQNHSSCTGFCSGHYLINEAPMVQTPRWNCMHTVKWTCFDSTQQLQLFHQWMMIVTDL